MTYGNYSVPNADRSPIKVIKRNPMLLTERNVAMDIIKDTGIKEKKQKSYTPFNEISYLAEEKPAYRSKGKHKGRYLDPRTDFGAKKIFGNDILLKSFFNHLFERIYNDQQGILHPC